jgi:predicted lipoprotein with Yx(FWY)xxD motif
MRNFKRLTMLAVPAAAALLLGVAACGSDAEGAGGSGSSGGVATSEVEGVGTVLVDAEGRALYTSEQEADGQIRCVDDCLEFWIPAEATGAESDVEELGTVTREDTGAEQLTYKGAPLYTFTLDAEPGQVTGDNLSDTFGGEEFTWHAAVTEADTGGGEEPDPGMYDY